MLYCLLWKTYLQWLQISCIRILPYKDINIFETFKNNFKYHFLSFYYHYKTLQCYINALLLIWVIVSIQITVNTIVYFKVLIIACVESTSFTPEFKYCEGERKHDVTYQQIDTRLYMKLKVFEISHKRTKHSQHNF